MDYIDFNQNQRLILFSNSELMIMAQLGYEHFDLFMEKDDFNELILGLFGDNMPYLTYDNWEIRYFELLDIFMCDMSPDDEDAIGFMAAMSSLKHEHEEHLMNL